MTMVQLINGAEVDSASPLWLAECAARDKHVKVLLAIEGNDRDAKRRRIAYIEQVQATEGAEAASRLHLVYLRAWTALRDPERGLTEERQRAAEVRISLALKAGA